MALTNGSLRSVGLVVEGGGGGPITENDEILLERAVDLSSELSLVRGCKGGHVVVEQEPKSSKIALRAAYLSSAAFVTLVFETPCKLFPLVIGGEPGSILIEFPLATPLPFCISMPKLKSDALWPFVVSFNVVLFIGSAAVKIDKLEKDELSAELLVNILAELSVEFEFAFTSCCEVVRFNALSSIVEAVLFIENCRFCGARLNNNQETKMTNKKNIKDINYCKIKMGQFNKRS